MIPNNIQQNREHVKRYTKIFLYIHCDTRPCDEDATESFFEDMVIDTKEAADNLNELVESGVTWKRGNSVLKFASADDEIARKPVEKHSKKK